MAEREEIFHQLPQDQEAERAVLGGMLLRNDSVPEIVNFLQPEDFFNNANRFIFEAIIEIDRRAQTVDILSLRDELTRRKKYDAVGGQAYLRDIFDNVIASANLMAYARIVWQKSLLRNLIDRSQRIIRDCMESSSDPTDIMRQAEQSIFTLANLHQRTDDLVPIGNALTEVIERIEHLLKNKNDVPGLSSGFADLDILTTGFHPGQLIILGARPGQGKTAMALNILQQTAIRNNKCVVMFSLEMSRQELIMRLLSSEAAIDGTRLRAGKIKAEEFRKLLETVKVLPESKIFLNDNSQLTIYDIRSRLQRLMRKEEKIDLVIVDYLQLMTSERIHRGENRQTELAEISRGLKSLARDLQVPVLALTQLNRGIENRQDQEPRLADIRESGAIEQDADIVMFLHTQRDDKEKRLSEQMDGPHPEMNVNSNLARVQLIIAKNRSGPQGKVNFIFIKNFTRFEPAEFMDRNIYE